MDYKTTDGRLKLSGQAGEFTAVFSRFNLIDKDGDVTRPGAFKDGQAVKVAAWGHKWGDLPVGRGLIHADDIEAWVDGEFFLNTEGGRETYETVKALGTLQEWSFGYSILDSKPGTFEGQHVRFLTGLDVHEVSPVMLGAGIGTRTTSIKGEASRDVLGTLAKIESLEAGTVEAWKGFYPAGALGIINAEQAPGALVLQRDLFRDRPGA